MTNNKDKPSHSDKYAIDGKYQFTHTELSIFESVVEGYGSIFQLNWVCDKVGFGQLTFYYKDNKFQCDTECMSEDFIQQAMAYHLANNTTYNHR